MSEGGGGTGRRNRGSRCRYGALADRLLHDTPPLHLVHHIFYGDKKGKRGEKMKGQSIKQNKKGKYVGKTGGNKRRVTVQKRNLEKNVMCGERLVEETHFTGSI